MALLQTAFIKISKPKKKNKTQIVAQIFDSGSQRTQCTETLKDTSTLKPIWSDLTLIKKIWARGGYARRIAQICIKSKNKSTNVYTEALTIPCLSIQGKSIETLDISIQNSLKNLDFADKYTSANSKKAIDILIILIL